MRSEANTGNTPKPGHQDVAWHQQNVNRLIEMIQTIDGSQGDAERAIDDSNEPNSGQLIEENAISLEHATKEQLGRMFLELADNGPLLANGSYASSLTTLFQRFSRRAFIKKDEFDDAWFNETSIAAVYRKVPSDSNGRNHLLAALASMQSDQALSCFAELIADDPPADERGVILGFSPLVNSTREINVDLLFPKLLEALKYKHLAAIILDLANFLFRRKMTSVHPAKPRVQQLTVLLGQVVSQLSLIEEGNIDGKSPQQISESVNESVALTVSLCDALALSEHFEAMGKVRQAMSLKHRRVKTEAAAALVRLGDTEEKEGQAQLIELASEPICRLRVIEYAKELDLIGEIDSEYCGPAAAAESQLAIWLSAPAQMGVAPTSMELIHQCQLRWPGFEEAITCFLIRFEYRFAGQTYSNIGIAGPLTHAFACNLEHLHPKDILAAFAGWQTEHEGIYTVEMAKARQALPGITETLSRRLKSECEDAVEKFVGFFFETPVLIAETVPADEQESKFVVAMDRDNDYRISVGSDHAPITAEIGFEIYKGQQLLGAFNDPEAFEDCRESQS